MAENNDREAALRFLREAASKGGRARVLTTTKEQRIAWGKKGMEKRLANEASKK